MELTKTDMSGKTVYLYDEIPLSSMEENGLKPKRISEGSPWIMNTIRKIFNIPAPPKKFSYGEMGSGITLQNASKFIDKMECGANEGYFLISGYAHKDSANPVNDYELKVLEMDPFYCGINGIGNEDVCKDCYFNSDKRKGLVVGIKTI